MMNFLGQGLENYDLWAKSGSLPAFINKVLLESNHGHLFVCCLWLLLYSKSRVE